MSKRQLFGSKVCSCGSKFPESFPLGTQLAEIVARKYPDMPDMISADIPTSSQNDGILSVDVSLLHGLFGVLLTIIVWLLSLHKEGNFQANCILAKFRTRCRHRRHQLESPWCCRNSSM